LEALELLERAAHSGRSPELSYLFGLALIDDGQRGRGMEVLEEALVRAPGDRDLLLALASQEQAGGASDRALRYLRRLAEINPEDPALQPAQ
jgi:Flp pilus assembly protein TadD